jgi:hypothetical protein
MGVPKIEHKDFQVGSVVLCSLLCFVAGALGAFCRASSEDGSSLQMYAALRLITSQNGGQVAL